MAGFVSCGRSDEAATTAFFGYPGASHGQSAEDIFDELKTHLRAKALVQNFGMSE